MQDLVTLVPWTFVAQICNLFLQVYLIKKFLFGPVRKILDERRAKADAQLADAAKANAEAKAMKEDYEKNLADANKTASDIIATAKRQAEETSDAIVQKAQAEAMQLKQRADEDIELEKIRTFNEMKGEIGDIAMEIAGKVIEREVSEEDHQKLIDDTIAQMGETVS